MPFFLPTIPVHIKHTPLGYQILYWFYFAILVILCLYGIHRYFILYMYLRTRKKNIKPWTFSKILPYVTVQIPMYNEFFVARRSIEAVSRLNYPRDRLQIQILDDSTDETRNVIETVVKQKQEQGYDIELIRRQDRIGYKAGALAKGLQSAKGDIIVVFDADFVPEPDFLNRCIHFFADPRVGIVQTRWGYLNQNFSLLTKLQSIWLDGYFMVEKRGRFHSNKLVNFCGSAGLLRKQAIIEAGGWQWDTLSEDLDLSIRIHTKGWKTIFVDNVVVKSELPVDSAGLKNQYFRWTKGAVQTMKKSIKNILTNHLPFHAKSELCMFLLGNFVYVFITLLIILMLPITLIRTKFDIWTSPVVDNLIFIISSLPVFLYGFFAQQYANKHRDILKKILILPLILALGIGLSVNNAKAVIEGLFGKTGKFVRTPKYNLNTTTDPILKRYAERKGVPLLEFIFFLYTLLQVIIYIHLGIYMMLPLVISFVIGFGMVILFWLSPRLIPGNIF